MLTSGKVPSPMLIVFGYWVNVVEIPQLCAVGPHPHLKAVAIIEDVVFFLQFRCFNFDV